MSGDVNDVNGPDYLIRFSHLKTIGTMSPAHVAAGTDHIFTPAMEIGTAVHAMIFKNRRVTFYPGAVRRGKEWEKFEADHADALVLGRTGYERAEAMANAVRAHPIAMKALDGVHEETILWEHLGLKCRATPDARTDAWVTELKCSMTSHPSRFAWHALKMHYPAQLGWYGEALLAAKHWKPTGTKYHHIVAVEDKPPFPVTVFRLTDRALEQGSKEWRLWFERLKTCRESRTWPTYTEAVVELDAPEEESLTFGGFTMEDAEAVEA